jgi:hypothetical protein
MTAARRSQSAAYKKGTPMPRYFHSGLMVTLMAVAADLVAAPDNVTFNKDVLPILQRNCQVCHRPGEIGPMSLMTYQAARPWAKAIKDASVLTSEFLVWYVPGMEAQRFDIDHSAKLIPAADLVLEVHYTANGIEGEDQTMVGLE